MAEYTLYGGWQSSRRMVNSSQLVLSDEFNSSQLILCDELTMRQNALCHEVTVELKQPVRWTEPNK